MPDPVSRILASRLGRLAGRGAFGAWLVARFLPDNVGETVFELPRSPSSIRLQATELLRSRGDLLDPSELKPAPDTLAAVVGAGRMALNPTVVTITITSGEGGAALIRVRAVAKEGLLKQRAGEEVAAWVQARLTAG
jgi:hypothetical protein